MIKTANEIIKFLIILFPGAAIPSLRARDCSSKEKEALNYLFLLVPLLNVIIPFFWKSFAVVWSADTVAFFLMYAWKVWLRLVPIYFFSYQITISSPIDTLFCFTVRVVAENRVRLPLGFVLQNVSSVGFLF